MDFQAVQSELRITAGRKAGKQKDWQEKKINVQRTVSIQEKIMKRLPFLLCERERSKFPERHVAKRVFDIFGAKKGIEGTLITY